MAAGGYYTLAATRSPVRTAVDDDRRGEDLVKRLAAVETAGLRINGER
jgi:hypothetical protein